MFPVNNLIFLAWCLYLVFASSVVNAADQYVLQKVAQAPQLTAEKSQWLLLEKSGNNRHYYIANTQGEIYQLDQHDINNTVVLLALKKLPHKKSIVKLSAFTLHPNFSLRDQEGYGTFYTAHVENSTANKTKRLQESAIKQPIAFDAVITEWQLTSSKKVDISSQREILKIAIPTANNSITQLSFNPYSTLWDEDFSQLYIALDQDSALKTYPLYSGVILRIKPQTSALASYSLPHDNPFLKHDKIDSAIYILGAGKIEQFIWPDKYSRKLLISHKYSTSSAISSSIKNSLNASLIDDKSINDTHGLSYAYGGEDWRKQTPNKFLYKNANQNLPLNNHAIPSKLLNYQGENIPALRNKLLLLNQHNQHWQLSSLTRNKITTTAQNYLQNNPQISQQNTQKSTQQNTPTLLLVEWKIPQAELIAKQLTLHNDNRGELLFFNNISGAIYQLFKKNELSAVNQSDATTYALASSQDEEAPQTSSFGGVAVFFIIISALLLAYIFYQVKLQKISAKALIRREYSGLALTDDSLSLNLFRRHQKKVETVLELVDIHQCQVVLGDNTVATINPTPEYGFNDHQEQKLRSIFHDEQVAKMIDGKIRRIRLTIDTSDKDSYIIGLYMRKGSDRLTKSSYFEVVDEVIDWCWYFSEQLNSDHTGKRVLRPKLTAADIAKAEHKTNDNTPLHSQAAKIRPALQSQASNKASTAVTENIEHTENNDNIAEVIEHEETDLVYDLEKLVELKQQGFLTAEEFTQAKATLLNDVTLNDSDVVASKKKRFESKEANK